MKKFISSRLEKAAIAAAMTVLVSGICLAGSDASAQSPFSLIKKGASMAEQAQKKQEEHAKKQASDYSKALYKDCKENHVNCDLFVEQCNCKDVIYSDCEEIKGRVVFEKEEMARDAVELKGIPYVTRDFKLTPQELEAENQKNKKCFESLTMNSSAIETRRAEAYFTQVVVNDLSHGKFPLDYYYDQKIMGQYTILRQLLTTKYNSSPVRDSRGDLENCKNFAEGDSTNDTRINDIKENFKPYHQTEEFQNACKTFNKLVNYSDKRGYRKGYMLDPRNDMAYHVGYSVVATATGKFTFKFPRRYHVANTNEYEWRYQSISASPGSLLNGLDALDALETFGSGALEIDTSSLTKDDTNYPNDPYVQPSLDELVKRYQKIAAECKDSVSCRAFALNRILEKRNALFVAKGHNLNDPRLMPKDDASLHTEEFKKFYDSIPADIRKGYMNYTVPTAKEIGDLKKKLVEEAWQENEVVMTKAGMHDSQAEAVIKNAFLDRAPDLKVKKVVLLDTWAVYTNDFGIPTRKGTEGRVYIQDPYRKNGTLKYRYDITVFRDHQGGGKYESPYVNYVEGDPSEVTLSNYSRVDGFK